MQRLQRLQRVEEVRKIVVRPDLMVQNASVAAILGPQQEARLRSGAQDLVEQDLILVAVIILQLPYPHSSATATRCFEMMSKYVKIIRICKRSASLSTQCSSDPCHNSRPLTCSRPAFESLRGLRRVAPPAPEALVDSLEACAEHHGPSGALAASALGRHWAGWLGRGRGPSQDEGLHGGAPGRAHGVAKIAQNG